MPENPSASATLSSPDLDPVRLVSQLIAVRSVNPGLVPDAKGEKGMAEFCSQWLGDRGFEVHRLEKHSGRPSIVAIARGTGGGRSLMLNGHLDTVGVASYEGDPFEPQARNGKLYGRGAFDMKGGIAAMMIAAVRATSRGPLRGDVIVACVCDEENSSYGTEEALEHVTADAAVITEPSHLEVTLAHKGFALFDVEIVGRTAHGSQPELGIDAIAKAGHFLIALEQLGQRLAEGPRHPLLGTGAVRASLIHGGEELFTIPAHCRVTVERRTVPGEDAESVTQELTSVLGHLADTVPDFHYRLTPGLCREPFAADPETDVVRTLIRHAEQVLGHPPVVRAEPFWTDASLLDQAGIPSLVFGVDGGGAHAATEWVDIASLHHLTEILTGTVEEFCS